MLYSESYNRAFCKRKYWVVLTKDDEIKDFGEIMRHRSYASKEDAEADLLQDSLGTACFTIEIDYSNYIRKLKIQIENAKMEVN